MKKQQQFAGRKQRIRQKSNRRCIPLSLSQRLTRSWVINAVVIPLLVSLFGAIVTLLLTHWGK
jgi:hypothetical protein